MSFILILVHIVVCIALIMIVLLQTGKGADMGAAFGGGSSHTLFGSTGASTFLSKATTFAAVVFMLTSLSLAYMSSHKTGGSVVMDAKIPDAKPVEQPAVSDNTAKPATSEKKTGESVKVAEPEKAVQPSEPVKVEPATGSQPAAGVNPEPKTEKQPVEVTKPEAATGEQNVKVVNPVSETTEKKPVASPAESSATDKPAEPVQPEPEVKENPQNQ